MARKKRQRLPTLLLLTTTTKTRLFSLLEKAKTKRMCFSTRQRPTCDAAFHVPKKQTLARSRFRISGRSVQRLSSRPWKNGKTIRSNVHNRQDDLSVKNKTNATQYYDSNCRPGRTEQHSTVGKWPIKFWGAALPDGAYKSDCDAQRVSRLFVCDEPALASATKPAMSGWLFTIFCHRSCRLYIRLHPFFLLYWTMISNCFATFSCPSFMLALLTSPMYVSFICCVFGLHFCIVSV